MKLQTTIILVVACVLGTWVIERLERDRGFWFQKDVDQPFSFPLDSVQQIRIERPRGVLVLVRENGDMWLREPIRCPASYARTERVATVLRELRVRGEIDGDPGRYGVGTAGLSIDFWVGAKRHRIELGDRHPQFPYVYATLQVGQNAAPRLVMIDASIADAFGELEVEELRDRTLCDVNSFRAGRVEIVDRRVTPPVRTVLVRNEQGWSMTQPVAVDADLGEVRQLVEVLNSWSIDAFVADDVDFQSNPQYGFSPPRWEISVAPRIGASASRLVVGADGPPDAEGRPRVFVAMPDGRSVYLATAEVLALLDRSPDVYRDQYLLRLPEPEVAELRVEIPEGFGRRPVTLRVARDEVNRWWVTIDHVARYPVDPAWFAVVASEIRAASAAQFLAYDGLDREESKRVGFDRPVRIRVTPEVGDPEEILVGAEVPGRPGEHYIVNPRWNHYAVTAVPPIEDLLREAPWAFRSTIVSQLEPDDLVEFSLAEASGMRQVFVRPHRTWFREGRGEQPLPAEDMNRIVRELALLRATAWLPEVESPPGPGDHELRIELRRVRGSADFEPRVFYVSALRGGRDRWIRDGAEGWVFLVRSDSRGSDPFSFMLEFLRRG